MEDFTYISLTEKLDKQLSYLNKLNSDINLIKFYIECRDVEKWYKISTIINIRNYITKYIKEKYNKIELVLNDKQQLQTAIDSLESRGMSDAAEIIQNNADDVKHELKKIWKTYGTVTVKDGDYTKMAKLLKKVFIESTRSTLLFKCKGSSLDCFILSSICLNVLPSLLM